MSGPTTGDRLQWRQKFRALELTGENLSAVCVERYQQRFNVRMVMKRDGSDCGKRID